MFEPNTLTLAHGLFLRSRRLSALVLFLSFSAVCAYRLPAQTAPADAGRSIQDQEARLGAQPGTVVLAEPSRLATPISLAAGHALLIQAPLTVAGGSIRLSGHNDVRCSAPISVDNGVDLFTADGATDLSVRGCTVKVTGHAGGYLLTATRGARITATDNHLTGMAIFNTHNTGGAASQTTDVTFTGNSTLFPPGGGPIGTYLLYVPRGPAANNRFQGTGHGIEWWGGDANEGWPGYARVINAGNLSITGNVCVNGGGSCVWGSDGVDIRVSGNSADGCGDVCFDTEGGVRTTFTHNTARNCGNGCYAAEFESQDVIIDTNTAFADEKGKAAALVLIKHPSGRGPNHINLTITNNTLTCGYVCAALYSEGEDGVTVANNTITNGGLQFINYTNNVFIRNNTLHFTLPLNGVSGINGPALANGHRSEITGNTIVAQAGATGNGSCIAQGWSDYNSTDTMLIAQNTCTGFPAGITTATGGGNPGAPHAVWQLSGNRFSGIPAAQQVVHQHSSGNEVYQNRP